MSDSSDEEHINDIILDEPMFYILTQFLETKDGKNIATILNELTTELKALRIMFQASSSAKSSSNSASTSVQTNSVAAPDTEQ